MPHSLPRCRASPHSAPERDRLAASDTPKGRRPASDRVRPRCLRPCAARIVRASSDTPERATRPALARPRLRRPSMAGPHVPSSTARSAGCDISRPNRRSPRRHACASALAQPQVVTLGLDEHRRAQQAAIAPPSPPGAAASASRGRGRRRGRAASARRRSSGRDCSARNNRARAG